MIINENALSKVRLSQVEEVQNIKAARVRLFNARNLFKV